MATMVFGAKNRKKIEFEFEFINGDVKKYTLKEMTSKQNESMLNEVRDTRDSKFANSDSKRIQLEYFAKNIVGEKIDEMIEEADENFDIFNMINDLNNEMRESAKKK